jgi:hypothetical protein
MEKLRAVDRRTLMIATLKTPGIAAAIVLLAAAPSAVAEENTQPSIRQDIGVRTTEPLGDREGHMISTGGYSCHVNSGPTSGSAMTGSDTWEFDWPNAVMLSDSAVVLKQGAIVVYRGTEGKLALTMADGKVIGWTAALKTTRFFC